MKFIPEEVHCEPMKGLHWTRVVVRQNEGDATVLACAARNYIADKYNSEGVAQAEHIEQWLNDLIKELQETNEGFEPGRTYQKIYSFTPEGATYAEKFLADEVTP